MINDEKWESLKHGIKTCTKCTIRKNCNTTVFGSGYPHANVMVIGEAPGATEDKTGKPFQGRAGQLLRKWLYHEVDFQPEQLFVTNILKCRPTNNRDPRSTEKKNCFPWLEEQIDIIDPQAFIFVGRIAFNLLMETNKSAGEAVKQPWAYRNKPALCIYHPSFILRPNGAKYQQFTIDKIQEFKTALDAYQMLQLYKE